VSSSFSMRVRVLFLTSGIRAILSCSLNISCSSPSHASLGPQPAAGIPAVPAHLSSPTQTSSSSSEAAPSSRSSPPLACHVRRTVSALGRLERAAPAGEAEVAAAEERERAAAAQTGADVPVAGLTEIATFTGGAALPPRTGIMVTMGSRPLSGMSVPAAGGLPSPIPSTSSGPR
jgi:hypothetical protein